MGIDENKVNDRDDKGEHSPPPTNCLWYGQQKRETWNLLFFILSLNNK